MRRRRRRSTNIEHTSVTEITQLEDLNTNIDNIAPFSILDMDNSSSELVGLARSDEVSARTSPSPSPRTPLPSTYTVENNNKECINSLENTSTARR